MVNQEEGTAEGAPIGAFFQNKQTTSSSSQEEERDITPLCLVEEAQEDRDSDTFVVLNEAGINSAMNGVPEGAQEGPAEQIKQEDVSDDRPVKRKRNKHSLIWRHYEQPDGLASARCCICMKSLPFEGCGTGNLYRHMSKTHPEEFSQLAADRQHPPPPHSSQTSDVKVEVVPEDGDCDTLKSTINGIPECAQGGPSEQIKHEEASDDHPVKCRRSKRSLIWRHYEQLDSLAAARCSLCMKSVSFEGGGTSNLHRHLSRKHPEVFSQLAADRQHPPPPHSSPSSDVNDDTLMLPENIGATEKQRQFSGLLNASVGEERRLFRRVRKLMAALRRVQPEEAWELEHQRELLVNLHAVNAREAAAEREQIESLRTAQLEEAKDLSRQREEVQEEKTALLKKWEELREERERQFYKGVGTNLNPC